MIVFQVKYFKWVRRKMKTNEPKKNKFSHMERNDKVYSSGVFVTWQWSLVMPSMWRTRAENLIRASCIIPTSTTTTTSSFSSSPQYPIHTFLRAAIRTQWFHCWRLYAQGAYWISLGPTCFLSYVTLEKAVVTRSPIMTLLGIQNRP